MAGKSTALTVRILGDAKPLARELDRAEKSTGGFSSKLGKLGGLAAAGFGAAAVAVGGIAVKAFEAASALQQSTGAVESVFGKQAAAIEKFADRAATAVGLSENAYKELAAVIGAQLGNAGFAGEKLTGQTDELIEMGADLAATFGGTTADAVSALSSALKGELDPLERYGVGLKQAEISSILAARGQDKLTGTALKNAQAQAVLDSIYDQTGSSVGAFAKESDSAAGSQQRLSAKFENIMATLGEKLLPVFEDVVVFIEEKILPAVEDLVAGNGDLGAVFEKVGAFIEETALPAFEKIWAFIDEYVIPTFENYLSPAIEGITAAWEKITDAVERNKDEFKPLFDFLRDKLAPFLGGALKLAFEALGDVISGLIDAAGWLFDKLDKLVGMGKDAWSWASDLFSGGDSTLTVTGGGGGLVGAAAGMSAPLVGAVLGSSAGGGPVPAAAGRGDTYVNITVEGALDPVAVGRQIDALVRRYATTAGRSPVALGWAR